MLEMLDNLVTALALGAIFAAVWIGCESVRAVDLIRVLLSP
jgi:hypothetical protein